MSRAYSIAHCFGSQHPPPTTVAPTTVPPYARTAPVAPCTAPVAPPTYPATISPGTLLPSVAPNTVPPFARTAPVAPYTGPVAPSTYPATISPGTVLPSVAPNTVPSFARTAPVAPYTDPVAPPTYPSTVSPDTVPPFVRTVPVAPPPPSLGAVNPYIYPTARPAPASTKTASPYATSFAPALNGPLIQTPPDERILNDHSSSLTSNSLNPFGLHADFVVSLQAAYRTIDMRRVPRVQPLHFPPSAD